MNVVELKAEVRNNQGMKRSLQRCVVAGIFLIPWGRMHFANAAPTSGEETTDSAEARIIGGKKAKQGDYPFFCKFFCQYACVLFSRIKTILKFSFVYFIHFACCRSLWRLRCYIDPPRYRCYGCSCKAPFSCCA